MVSKYFLLLFFLLTVSNAISQKNIEPTEENILLATNLSDLYPDEDIALLNHSETIDFKYDTKTDKVIVLHKFKQEFMNLKSRTKIPLIIGYNDQSKIKDTYVKYRNGKSAGIRFKDEYYNEEGLFHSDARIKWAGLNFPLFGYTYTFGYQKKYRDVKYFINTYLDGYFPIVKKNITINIPHWLDIEVKEINMEGISVKKEENQIKGKGITQYTYTIKDTKAASKEENSLGPTHYRPHLLFLAKSHTKNKTKEVLLNDTKDLYNWYHSLVLQLKNENDLLQEKTLSIIKEYTTDEEKIKAIYYWVQDNIRYIAFEDGIAGFKPEEAINVYRKRYGDCKGMANLTKQMMKIAGFDARLSWIGTKRIAYDYSLPTIAVDNHMICTVILNDKKYFLDPTEKYNPLGAYAERIQQKQVLIENEENYILDTIPSSNSKKNNETLVATLRIENEKLVGTTKRNYTGESKTDLLYKLNNIKKDRKNEILEYYIGRGNKNLILRDISITDINNREENLELSYNLIQNNAISSFENELYIDIDYYKDYASLDFGKRETAFVFPHKIMETYLITLEIPEKYTIKELPKELSVKNSDFDFSINYKSEGNKIIYTKNINFKNALIGITELENWNLFHKKLKEQYQQQIVLTRKN